MSKVESKLSGMEGKKGHEMARMARTQRAEYGHRSKGNMELPF